jgi:hypothetical protein
MGQRLDSFGSRRQSSHRLVSHELRAPVAHAEEQVRLVAVSTFRSTADAHVAKGILDEVGIESVIRSDNAGGMYPALAGADLLVRAEDAEKAFETLRSTASRDNRGSE